MPSTGSMGLSPRANVGGMRIAATTEAIEIVRASGGRLYVWQERSSGCQPMTFLQAAAAPAAGRTFHRADFAAFELYLAASGRWPLELRLETRRGRVQARWDGSAWAL